MSNGGILFIFCDGAVFGVAIYLVIKELVNSAE